MFDVEQYLKDKDIKIFNPGSRNIHVPCFFHGESDETGRLYICQDEDRYGVFTCFICQEKGSLNRILKHFGDDPVKLDGPPDDSVLAVFADAAEHYQEQLQYHPEALEYLTGPKRGLLSGTIKNHQLGWADGKLVTALIAKGHHIDDIKATGLVDYMGNDFLQDCITIPYHLNDQVIQIRGKYITSKYETPKGQKAALFNIDLLLDEEEVLLVEGEMDSISLEQLGYAAIGLPGVNTFKNSWIKYFDDVKRIYICFDNDGPGKEAAAALATKLGDRARIVELPQEYPDADVTDLITLHGKSKDDFDYYLKKARGGTLISVREAYDEWLDYEGNPHLSGIRFNIEKIDQAMTHGLLPGHVASILSKTSSGKTVLTLNLFDRMSQIKPDIKILFLSLEQTRNEWFERALKIRKFYDWDADARSTIDYWSPRLMLSDKNRLSVDELIECIDQYEYEMGRPDIVAIDYLGYFARSFRGEAYERTGAAIMELKRIAKERRVIMFVPHQANRTADFGQEFQIDQGSESGLVEMTCDFIAAIWNSDQRKGIRKEDQTGDITLKVHKSRDGGTGIVANLKFSPISLAIIPHGDKRYDILLAERKYHQAGDDQDMAIYRHKTGDQTFYEGGIADLGDKYDLSRRITGT